jgi:glycyl-tRNA synthetase
MFLAIMSSALQKEALDNGEERTVLKIHPTLAPNKVAILPLVKKDGLPEKARELFDKLKFETYTFYDEKDSIGKRYRRQDALGTPYCITIDHQSLEDNTATIRDRDSMTQERISIDNILNVVREKTSWNNLLA